MHTGIVNKLTAVSVDGQPLSYALPISGQSVELNALLGAPIKLAHTGSIYCIHCGRLTRKSFSQGYCYPCMQRLARCDQCIIKPELCHYHNGTCREPEWGEQHCLQDHIVYLADTSGVKVGVTRATQIPNRWIDQGATQALPILRTHQRKVAGIAERFLTHWVADKTNWRVMLRGDSPVADLKLQWQQLQPQVNDELLPMIHRDYGVQAITALIAEWAADLWIGNYPVLTYPTKIVSMSFDKTAQISGTLKGIKGQYLLLDTGVVNIRKHCGYEVNIE